MAKSYGTHEVADIFPSMTDIEYEALKASIAENGQREAIVAVDDLIVDGRHRYKACQELGVAPRVRQIKDQGDGWLIGYVLDANLHRRHLSVSQRAAMAAEMPKMEHGGDRKSNQVAFLRHDYEDGSHDTIVLSQGERAERLNISKRSVEKADRIKRENPDAIAEMKAGRITLAEAEQTKAGRQSPPVSQTETSEAIEYCWQLIDLIKQHNAGTIIAAGKTFTSEEGGDAVIDLDDLVSDS